MQITRSGAGNDATLLTPAAVQIGGYLRIAADQRWLQTVIRFRAWRRAKRRIRAAEGHAIRADGGAQNIWSWRQRHVKASWRAPGYRAQSAVLKHAWLS